LVKYLIAELEASSFPNNYSSLLLGRICSVMLPASATALLSQEISALALDSKPGTPFLPSTPLHTRRSSFLTSSRPPSASLAAPPGPSSRPFGNDSLNLMSPLCAPVVDLSCATVTNLRSPGRGLVSDARGRASVILGYSSGHLMRLWLPPLATSLVGRALAAVKQLLPRELALQLDGAWYSGRHAPGPGLAPADEWTLFCKCLLSLAGYQVFIRFCLPYGTL
jgi:hypothetical protein